MASRILPFFLAMGGLLGCAMTAEPPVEKVYTCPPGENGFFTDADCTPDYYYCYNGIAYPQVCPCSSPEQCPVFDSTVGACVQVIECASRITTTSTTAASTSTTTITVSTLSTTTLLPSTLRPITCYDDGFYPVPQTCTSAYYVCLDGVSTPQKCPGNSIFDPVTYACISSAEASCVKPFECPSQSGTSFHPYSPEACSSLYFICINGVAILQYCPDNSIFHPELLTCLPPGEKPPCAPGESYTASTTQSSPTTTSTTLPSTTLRPFTCTNNNGFFPVPESCISTFYICIDGILTTESCPEGIIFDPVTYKCTPSEQASCNEPFECISESGTEFYPYSPEACSSLYYICVDGVSSTRYCPENTVFLPNLLTCVPYGMEPPCTPGQPYLATTIEPFPYSTGALRHRRHRRNALGRTSLRNYQAGFRAVGITSTTA